MYRLIVSMTLALGWLAAASSNAAAAQALDSSIVSEHVRIRIPTERAWLGRDVVMELERCWRFVNPATGESLPRRLLVAVDWEGSVSSASPRDGTITVGLNQPAAAPDVRAFLVRESAREMARLGLLNLARQAAPVERTAFLFQGMAELLGREFNHSTRGLGSAWVLAHLLDRMKLLGISAQSSWDAFSEGRNDLRAAAPGVTFLMTCRETYGREKILKLFEGLRKGNLEESVSSTFRTSLAALEVAWLKKVRELPQWSDVTITSDEDAPVLEKSELPRPSRPGETLQLRVYLRDRTRDLLPSGIFAIASNSGAVAQAQPGPAGAPYVAIDLGIEKERRAGSYGYRLTAVDESGNIRNWDGSYSVGP